MRMARKLVGRLSMTKLGGIFGDACAAPEMNRFEDGVSWVKG